MTGAGVAPAFWLGVFFGSAATALLFLVIDCDLKLSRNPVPDMERLCVNCTLGLAPALLEGGHPCRDCFGTVEKKNWRPRLPGEPYIDVEGRIIGS